MMQYLSGLTEIGKSKSKSSFSKPFKKFGKNVKKLDAKAKALNKKINDDAKKLAKLTGKGLKRIAKIPKSFAFKKLIWALEHDFMNLSTRIKALYKQNPQEAKDVLSKIGDYSKIISAVNKGAKGSAISGGYNYGCKCGNQNVYAVECCKGKSAKSMIGEVTPEQAQQYAEYSKEAVGLIKQIIDWFKKRKADKQGDAETIGDMGESVDSDSDIPKEDENGNDLPVSPLAPKKESSMLMPIVIGGAVLAGGYFLLKKKK